MIIKQSFNVDPCGTPLVMVSEQENKSLILTGSFSDLAFEINQLGNVY